MITPARQVFDDVRALGTSTPVRAAYELSKRSGFHGVLFRPVRSAQPVRSELVLLGNITTWSESARQRTLRDARLIESDGLRVFGARTSTGRRDPWNTDPQTGRAWPADRPWWQLDIRSDERLGDVKYVWEAGRHRDLVVLARAVQLEPTGPWAELLNTLLQLWCAQNPPEHGVHWYSSLEIALRAIAWSQVLALAGDVLTPAVRERLDAQLLAGTRHIMVELPYTLSSMRNNHLLGDALGLLIAARLFPSHGSAQRWQKVGDRLFAAQLPRHMRTDGSMIEDSLSYHRFVLEMLAVRVLLGDARAAQPAPRAALDRTCSGSSTGGYELDGVRYFTINDDGSLHYLSQAEIDADTKNGKSLRGNWKSPAFAQSFANVELQFQQARRDADRACIATSRGTSANDYLEGAPRGRSSTSRRRARSPCA